MHSSFQRQVVIAIAAFTVLMANNLAATVWCVNLDGSGGCDTLINAAIAKASAGDTVFVWDGFYRENVSIAKQITLLGADATTTIVSPSTGNAISTLPNCSGVIIQGLTATAPTGHGIVLTGTGPRYVRNCIIRQCGLDGLWSGEIGGTSYVANVIIFKNTLRGITHFEGSFYLFNSIVAGNGTAGVCGQFPDRPFSYTFSCFYDNNSLAFCGYSGAGAGIVIESPQFIESSNGDFHLALGSPCIDSGREGPAYEDCDGTRNDMGVYGGPDAVCGPGPSVTELQIVPATVVKGQSFKVQAKATTK